MISRKSAQRAQSHEMDSGGMLMLSVLF